MRRLLLSPLWLLLLLPGYIGWRLLSAMSLGPRGLIAGIALLVACCWFIPLSVRTRAMENRRLAEALSWVGLTAMGFLSSLFVLTLMRDIVLLGTRWFLTHQQAASWAAATAQWTLLLTVLVTIAGFVIARRMPGVVEVKIPLAGLPQALHGFSIAQISDVHVGPTIKRGFVEGNRAPGQRAERGFDRRDRGFGRRNRAATVGSYRAIGRTDSRATALTS